MKRYAVVLVLACLAGLTSCSDDSSPGSSSDPVEVEVGKAFDWNDFAVEDGWTVEGIERAVDMEQVTTPEVTGTIINKSEETRTALFQIVFSVDADPVATVNCSAAEMIKDQAMQFVCPGLNTTMPQDYDAVVVQNFPDRDSSSG